VKFFVDVAEAIVSLPPIGARPAFRGAGSPGIHYDRNPAETKFRLKIVGWHAGVPGLRALDRRVT
jgi:hypothetical protein